MFVKALTPYVFRFFEEEGGGSGSGTEKTAESQKSEEKEDKVPVATLIKERKERQRVEAELDKIKADIKAKEEEELKKNGEVEKLLNAEKAEHAKTKQELEVAKVSVTEYTALQAVERAELKTKLGTEWEEEFDVMPLPTLKKIASKIASSKNKPAPSGDGGAGGDGEIKLTDDEKKEAQKMGLSEEGFVKYKQRSLELNKK